MTHNLAFRWTVIAVVIALTGWVFIANKLQLGIDLQGGRSMTYGVAKSALQQIPAAEREKAMSDTVATISNRVDKLGVKELTIRRIGDDKIVIEQPKMEDSEARAIQEQMLALGSLEFLIALREPSGQTPEAKVLNVPTGQGDATEPYTFSGSAADAQRKAAYETGKTLRGDSYRDGEPYTLLQERGGQWVDLPIKWLPQHLDDKPATAAFLKELNDSRRGTRPQAEIDHTKIGGYWLYADPEYFNKAAGKPGFTGQDITDPRRSFDRNGGRSVAYNMGRGRQSDFESYTSKYVNQPMAIALNEEVWSAPTINSALRDSVEISRPGGFDEDEQSMLVNCLTSGSLRLKPRLESEETIGPSLGEIATTRGIWATIVAFAATIAFMVWFYRSCGLVANIALILNLVLILATLALFQATLTLPGIAGIILTIGMAVDANILVFERSREESARGQGIVAAMEAGYDRAFITIFDANITTAMTAAILIKFGSGPIRGFGVTLLAGIAISMFTALYVTKTIFGWLLNSGMLTKLNFINALPVREYDWLGKAKPWQTLSIVLVLLGFGMFLGTGDEKYGLDFTGGTVAGVRLATPVDQKEVTAKLGALKDPSGAPRYLEIEVLPRNAIAGQPRSVSDEFELKLRSSTKVDAQDVKTFAVENLGAAIGAVPTIGTPTPMTGKEGRVVEGEWLVEFSLPAKAPVGELLAKVENYADANGNRPFAGAGLSPVNPETVDDVTSADKYTIEVARQDVARGNAANDIRAAFGDKLAKDPFKKINYLGPSVVANLKEAAIVSIILSLAAIVLYMWFRFKELYYGIAATIALAHDVMVPLGLSILLNKLGIINAPLNLQSIAAFLTIIGFSINDTIVIFDRVRENIGTMSSDYRKIVNVSLSQTLSRTIFTSATVFFVVTVLFGANVGVESPLEGLAFCLLVGTVAGTYSTIFVACPMAVWLKEREDRKNAAASVEAKPAKA